MIDNVYVIHISMPTLQLLHEWMHSLRKHFLLTSFIEHLKKSLHESQRMLSSSEADVDETIKSKEK